jgi:hypothetical protein
MGKSLRNNGHRITRLTLSGGNRAQPRLMLAHTIGEPKRRPWLAVAFVIAVVVIIALAGRSL